MIHTLIRSRLFAVVVSIFICLSAEAASFGPFNGEFISEGIYGIKKPIPKSDPVVKGASDWSINFWVKPDGATAVKTLLAGFGDGANTKGTQRYLAYLDDGLRFWGGSVDVLMNTGLEPAKWQMLTAVYGGGVLRLYKDGREMAAKPVVLADAKPEINLAPLNSWGTSSHFGGKIAGFTLVDRAMSAEEIGKLAGIPQHFEQLVFVKGAPESWDPKANTSRAGEVHQDPASLPQSKVGPQKPAAPKPPSDKTLVLDREGGLILAGPWQLNEAPKVSADGAALSAPGYQTKGWYAATVPGTVLTTLVDQGVYPDPYFGLNNLSIPTTLSSQDYWYRLEFVAPANLAGKRSTITFNGINYEAEVWLNGARLGDIKGAFIRGIFDVSRVLKPGQRNALAVKISPPPHPGTSHEQSIKAGAGPNGGAMCWDGPTFFCSEGWDWIPGIRDRETGLWQDVVLKATDAVSLGDPQVVTRVPEPVGSRADVTLNVELKNTATTPQTGTLKATFEGVALEKKITLPADSTQTFHLTPGEFPQLAVAHPRLWWPNGYGKPELYHLTLSFESADGKTSDTKKLRFGMREMSFVLTAIDPRQQVGRYEFSPAAAGATEVIKHDHESIVKSPKGWVPTLADDASKLPGLRISDSTDTDRFLEIRVNGQRIAIRGGNCGMDEGMKRVSREQLEPYFRLQRDSNFNTIRNWCGQSTEETFFELCDEYGILVFNELWLTTQWANVEPKDDALWLANAKDSITRFRNHPSIAIWCGRNEGVPPPGINAELDELIRRCDGTRYYQPASIAINMSGSGPWKYIRPEEYFQHKGFTTELGLPSPLTADSIRGMMAPEDLWPINDVWAYHDWVPSGAMDVKTFMAALTAQFGEPTGFEDFVRKAQMINYVSYRAMYEGMNATLWKPTSGRLLWMSHPSWPSMVWQIYGWDYQPNASFYGVRKGCEPVHVQMNLPDYGLLVANTTIQPLHDAKITARIYALNGTLGSTKEATVDVAANSTAPSFTLAAPASGTVDFVKLELRDAQGALLSDNFYWRAPAETDLMAMNQLPAVKLSGLAQAKAEPSTGETVVTVELKNPTQSVALMTFLTLREKSDGRRILPAYADNNYVSLLPGEQRVVTIKVPAGHPAGGWAVTLEGWNLVPQTIPVR
ncbi:MAG TPA: LamG-like jellyroll fold domain-containing protein [Rariglobus sp.]|jgi:hypothetical protein|nr:LamG-like jellyroll fold domain-containing protein [Rariglobus sp.]